MIQRIQSIFLLGVVIFMALAISLTLWEYHGEGKDVVLNAMVLENISGEQVETVNKFHLAGIALASMAIALFSIFSFKKRKLQMILGFVNNILIAGFVGLVAMLEVPNAEDLAENVGSYGFGFFMPVGAVIMNILANRFIQKDENLVKSMDRIR